MLQLLKNMVRIPLKFLKGLMQSENVRACISVIQTTGQGFITDAGLFLDQRLQTVGRSLSLQRPPDQSIADEPADFQKHCARGLGRNQQQQPADQAAAMDALEELMFATPERDLDNDFPAVGASFADTVSITCD